MLLYSKQTVKEYNTCSIFVNENRMKLIMIVLRDNLIHENKHLWINNNVCFKIIININIYYFAIVKISK